MIHPVQIKTIAEKYGLPVSFKAMPVIGKGDIYTQIDYNNIIVVIVLFVILTCLFVFIKLGEGHMIFSSGKRLKNGKPPEHMV
ncbi:hypothetical protein ACFL20_07570 [Spirochaetota bacterium]